ALPEGDVDVGPLPGRRQHLAELLAGGIPVGLSKRGWAAEQHHREQDKGRSKQAHAGILRPGDADSSTRAPRLRPPSRETETRLPDGRLRTPRSPAGGS